MTIQEKTKTTIGFALVVASFLSLLAVASHRIEALEARFNTHEVRGLDTMEKIDKRLGEIQTDVAVIKTEVKNLNRR